MEEIKLLIELIANLPSLALWVLIGFWGYKVIVVGSIYGVIRFVVDKMYQAYINPRREDVHIALNKHLIGHKEDFIEQLNRLKGFGIHDGSQFKNKSSFVHCDGIEFLRRALDNEFERLKGIK